MVAIVVLSVLAAPTSVAQPEAQATKAQVLATAKQMSAQDCDPQRHPQQDKMLGCTYWAAFIEGQWWVTRVYDFEYKGQRTHASGGVILIFDRSGKFVKTVGGM